MERWTAVVEVDVPRVRRLLDRFGARFTDRWLSPDETALCMRRRRPEHGIGARLAARFAVRALCRRLGRPCPPRLVVSKDRWGAPVLSMPPLDGVYALEVSLAHDGDFAVAAVVFLVDAMRGSEAV